MADGGESQPWYSLSPVDRSALALINIHVQVEQSGFHRPKGQERESDCRNLWYLSARWLALFGRTVTTLLKSLITDPLLSLSLHDGSVTHISWSIWTVEV